MSPSIVHDTNLCNSESLKWRLWSWLVTFPSVDFEKKKILYKLIYKYIFAFHVFKKFYINLHFCLLEVFNEKTFLSRFCTLLAICYVAFIHHRFSVFLPQKFAAPLQQCYQILPCATSPCPPTLRTGYTLTAHFCATIYVKITLLPHLLLHQTLKA